MEDIVIVSAVRTPVGKFGGSLAKTPASALGAIDAHAERDAEVEALRCRSLGWLLDAVAGQPLEERAAITRLMLRDGLASLLQAAVEPSPDVSNPDH